MHAAHREPPSASRSAHRPRACQAASRATRTRPRRSHPPCTAHVACGHTRPTLSDLKPMSPAVGSRELIGLAPLERPRACAAASRLRSNLTRAVARSPRSSRPYTKGANCSRAAIRDAQLEADAAMSTVGRLSRVGAGRRQLGWSPGSEGHGRTTLSSSPRRRGSSGLFSRGSRVDSSSAEAGL